MEPDHASRFGSSTRGKLIRPGYVPRGARYPQACWCRAKLHKLPTGAGGDLGRYKGDQDPTDDAEGLEYAKNYTTLHLKTKKVNDSEDTAVKVRLLPIPPGL